MGIKGPQRNAMIALEPDRKRFLISQHQEFSSQTAPLRAMKTGPELSTEGTLAGLKRFSLVGWAAGGVDAKEVSSHQGGGRTSIYDRGSSLPFTVPATTTDNLSPTTPSIESGWTSWWSTTSTPTGTSSSHPNQVVPESTDTSEFYVAQIKARISQRSLVKILIALRVRLSTGKLSWTGEFLEGEGLEGLEGLLGRISTARVNRCVVSLVCDWERELMMVA